MFGKDVSKLRSDSLDKEILKFALNIKENQKKKALDLGSGSSRIGIALSLLNWEVLAFDRQDYSAHLDEISKHLQVNLTFFKKDLSRTTESFAKKYFPDTKIVIMQRFLHYLKYQNAQKLASLLAEYLPKGARVFVSVNSTQTIFAKNYPCAKMPIDKRYCKLEKTAQEKFNIKEKITLYDKKSLTELFENNSFKTIRFTKTRFGNYQAIFKKIC